MLILLSSGPRQVTSPMVCALDRTSGCLPPRVAARFVVEEEILLALAAAQAEGRAWEEAPFLGSALLARFPLCWSGPEGCSLDGCCCCCQTHCLSCVEMHSCCSTRGTEGPMNYLVPVPL